jgi:hypothetical protein
LLKFSEIVVEAEVLKTVGQVAGIGGIALGVLLLVFREVVRKQIFPQLTKQQAYRLLTTIVVLVWSVALFGIGAWIWTETSARARNGEEAGDRVETGQIIKDDATISDSTINISAGSAEKSEQENVDAAP